MENDQALFSFGAFFGMAFGVFIVYHLITYDCERDLPRSQECEIIAVPVEKVDE